MTNGGELKHFPLSSRVVVMLYMLLRLEGRVFFLFLSL